MCGAMLSCLYEVLAIIMAVLIFPLPGPPPPPCNPTYHIQQRGRGNVTISAQWEYPEWMMMDSFTVTVTSFWSHTSIPGNIRSVTLTLNYNEVYTIEITATRCGNHSDPIVLRFVEGEQHAGYSYGSIRLLEVMCCV